MVLGIATDLTTDVVLDAELTAIPSNGIYLNEGTHSSITLSNLLAFLPNFDLVPTTWSNATTYGKYTTTKNQKDLVTHGGKIYQSLQGSNTNQNPTSTPSYWLETNLESLRLKSFIEKVKARVINSLRLNKNLINSQKIYSVTDTLTTEQTLLPNDYCGWGFDAKGSDYVSIRINQISLQKSGTTPINLYVINQGNLITTLQITPSNGKVEFKDLNYTFKGEGDWVFAIDSTEVFTNGFVVDPLRYDGFVCYTVTGIGNAPETAKYYRGAVANGLGFNVTAFLDAETYVNNNRSEFGEFVCATFEMMCFEMFLHNSNNRSNREQKIQMNDELIRIEVLDGQANTVAKRYSDALKHAKTQLSKTFDTQLTKGADDGLEIQTSAF